MVRVVFFLTLLTPLVSEVSRAQEVVAFRSTTAIDVRTGEASPDTTVLVQDGTIAAIGQDSSVDVPDGARLVDGSGTWLIPGLVDIHTHGTGRDVLRSALALGVTTGLSIFTGEHPAPEVEDWSNRDEAPSPRVHLVVGRFSPEFPGYLVPGIELRSPETRPQAQTHLDELKTQGVRRIKIWQDDAKVWAGPEAHMPVLSAEVMEALIRGARERQMKVYVHAVRLSFYREALGLEPDWLIHPLIDARLESSDLEQLKRQGLGWTSTMTVLLQIGDPKDYAKRVLSDPNLVATLKPDAKNRLVANAEATEFEWQKLWAGVTQNLRQYVDRISENTRLAHKGGIVLSVGSDSQAGVGTHLEMELLAEAGLEPATILKAATLGGAIALDVSHHQGTVEVGNVADLVILGSNPLTDVRHFRDVVWIMKGGRLWSRAELIPAVHEPRHPG